MQARHEAPEKASALPTDASGPINKFVQDFGRDATIYLKRDERSKIIIIVSVDGLRRVASLYMHSAHLEKSEKVVL